MTRSRPAAVVAGAGVAIAVLLGFAVPAGAATGPVITVDNPSGGAVLTHDPAISGDASMPGSLDSIGNIAVSLTSPVTSDLPAPCDPCNTDHGHSEPFSWSPSLPRNGPYQIHVKASGSQFLFGVLDGEVTSDATASFQMEVKPGDPTGVRTEANPDQSVRVTWARNTEPDMIAYRVQRKDPGAATFHDIGGAVAQPSGGSTVSTVDPGAGPGGGTFVYQVQAIRAGRSGDASTAVGSGFSATSVVVAPSPTAAAPGPAGAAPGGPAESAAPTPNLSAFLSGGGAPPKASLPATPALPDGTFQENLPFAIPPANNGGRTGSEAIGLNAGSSGNGGRAVLIPIAGGLLLCLGAFHVRRFNGWLNATSNAPLAVVPGAVARRAPAPAPAPALPSKPAPVPVTSWLTEPATVARRNSPDLPTPAKDHDEGDDAKWAPLTPFGPQAAGFTTTGHRNGTADGPVAAPADKPVDGPTDGPAWEDILVKPGAGTTRRPW